MFNPLGLLIFVAGSLGIGAWTYYSVKIKDVQKRREAKRQELHARVLEGYLEIKEALIAFPIKAKTDRFQSYSSLNAWEAKYASLFAGMAKMPLEDLGLEPEVTADIVEFIESYRGIKALRAKANQNFIERELVSQRALLDNIGGISLDEQQRKAVLTDEDNNLVIAGAGTGKSTVILGKVAYLHTRFSIKPTEVLLLSFTKKSADSLDRKLEPYGFKATTFHRLGLDIISQATDKKPSIFDTNQFERLIHSFFEERFQNPNYLSQAIDFFAKHLKQYRTEFEFKTKAEYIQYLKDNNFKTFKEKEFTVGGRTTYKREIVKSVEECEIANFLYFNNVDYQYEYPYEFQTADSQYAQYRPDFKIIQGDTTIYLEHFGIARDGSVPAWFEPKGEQSAREAYHQGMEWKRYLHQSKNTILIETYSYEMSEGILLEELAKKLMEKGIALKPKSEKEKWEIISMVAVDEVEALISMASTYITLLKSNYTQEEIPATPFIDPKNNRAKEYWKFLEPIYQDYEDYLAKRNEIDFNDMIHHARNYIETGMAKLNLKYIIVDEYQDISMGRYKLIKALRDQSTDCRMFCVGDDWQSIYRFSGSDISLFKDFEDYFGYTEKSKIETTFRFNNPMIKLSSDFILKNPTQISKSLRGLDKNESTYEIVYSQNESDDTEALYQILEHLVSSGAYSSEKDILILSRYSGDINRLQNQHPNLQVSRSQEMVVYNTISQFEGQASNLSISIPFLTVHKSKGLEADFIIILNCNGGKYGFPSEMSDDPILDSLLAQSDSYPNSEERRLFYVAMTRARERTYFISSTTFQSKFISEIENCETPADHSKKCPKCYYGNIILRKEGKAKNGNNYRFYGCTNFIYGCEYQDTQFS
ncbi:UvrD-helicase domain-containing protein [Robiginitalea sediminis]|uniref:UvrD-helicase domain-containing protein n=1 Tax=Robiginitalea sediminis TaxID=1982593 RepID=UPI000B4B569E|nr:UvrD-helicase domain-containing protein [Robiginitalea sediminis]